MLGYGEGGWREEKREGGRRKEEGGKSRSPRRVSWSWCCVTRDEGMEGWRDGGMEGWRRPCT
jgi:hypothetical protein